MTEVKKVVKPTPKPATRVKAAGSVSPDEGPVVIVPDRNTKTFNIAGTEQLESDVEVFGADVWKCLCKASSKREGWMKSTKAMQMGNDVVLQVSTQQGDNVAEAITVLPGTRIDTNGKHPKLVRI